MLPIPIGYGVVDLAFVLVLTLGALVPDFLEEEVAHRHLVGLKDLRSPGNGSIG